MHNATRGKAMDRVQTKLSRRAALKAGSAAAGAMALSSYGTGVPVSAQETPESGITMSPEAQEYYLPEQSFDGVELNVVLNASFLSTPQRQEVMESLRLGFEEASGARVTYAPLPENQMYNQVRLELAQETGRYDMMHTGAGGALDYGLGGFLVPLPEPPDIADFYPAFVDQYSFGGRLYGLPMIGDINLIYWRSDLFEQAGLDPNTPPQTYDEFRDFAIRLTTDTNGRRLGDEGFDENDIEVYGSAFKGVAGLACTWEWYNYLYAFGGQLLDGDYNPTLNSPESVAALAWVVDNYRDHNIYPADTISYDYTEFEALFLQGRMAMGINWPSMWAAVNDPSRSNVVGQVKIGQRPSQVTHGGEIGGWSWNVFKMSQNQEAAVAFAKWMSSPGASLAYAQSTVGSPARPSVAAVMSDQDPEFYAAIDANLADGRSVEWLVTGPSWTEIERVQWEAIQRALIGDTDPQSAFDDGNEEIRGILEDNGFYEQIVPQLQS